MIISFTLFITALMFIYFLVTSLIINPNNAKNSLGTVEGNIISSVSSEVWVLRFYNTSSPTCFESTLPELIAGGQSEGIGNSGPVYSQVNGKNVSFNGTGFIKIFYSNKIVNSKPFSGSGCIFISPDSEMKEEMVLQENIISLISNFSQNYDVTKNALGVPSGMDMDIKFKYKNGTIIGGGAPTPETNVYAGSIELNYLSFNGSYETGTLGVKIW